ncbi:hypothetical protein Cni_G25544 [Canna indica]|uniref:Uncharacterized protein n=1 Tax=Canna indica TaxID=4628 RepID=A0AAQ3QPI6_9LILI|nr:hypothetical protein Cni_G25544 [Canna indica]
MSPLCARVDCPTVCEYVIHTYGHNYNKINTMKLLSMRVAKAAVEHSELEYKLSPGESDATCIRQYGDTLADLKKGRDTAKADTSVEHHGQAERLLEEDGGQHARAQQNSPGPSVKGK